MSNPSPQVASGFTAFVDTAGKSVGEVITVAQQAAHAADVGTTWAVLTTALSASLPVSLANARSAGARMRAGRR